MSNNCQQENSQNKGYYSGSYSDHVYSNNSTKANSGSGAYLAHPGVQSQANINPGMSTDEIKPNNFRKPLRPNFHTPSYFNQRRYLPFPMSHPNLTHFPDKMKNRRATFNGAGQTGFTFNFQNQENNNLPPVIPSPIIDSNRFPEYQQDKNKKQNSNWSITRPITQAGRTTNTAVKEYADLNTEGVTDTSFNNIYGGKRISNLTVPNTLKGNHWGHNPLISHNVDQDKTNFNLQNNYPLESSYVDRNIYQMFPRQNYSTPWPSVTELRSDSQFLGSSLQKKKPNLNYNQRAQEFSNQLKVTNLKPYQEERCSKAFTKNEQDCFLENINIHRLETLNGNSLKSGDHQRKKSAMYVPKMEKQRVSSFNLGNISGQKINNNLGTHSDCNGDEPGELKCRRCPTQEQSNLEVNDKKSSSTDDETDFWKECFAL